MFILISFYWVSMLKFIFGTKWGNNRKKAPFDILGASTETENVLRGKTIIEREIVFLVVIDRYSWD